MTMSVSESSKLQPDRNIVMATLVLCPVCGCLVRETKLASHQHRVHGATPLPLGGSLGTGKVKQPRKFGSKLVRKAAKSRAAEQRFQEASHKRALQARKCLTDDCQKLIHPPDQYCEACRQQRVSLAADFHHEQDFLRACRMCGAPVVGEEDYCFGCVGG
jgi:hypothetical protein